MRQFQREFLRQTGASPKTFARIARFQAALDAKITSPQRTWLDIAHSFGYHDQMHMIHDFEILGRSCPTQLIAEIGDSRPPALTPLDEDLITGTHLLAGSAEALSRLVLNAQIRWRCRFFTMHNRDQSRALIAAELPGTS